MACRAQCSASRRQVALFPGEGQHAVQLGHVGGLGQGLPGHAHHVGRAPQVEQVVLPQLERGQVARELAGLLLVQDDGALQIAIDPGGHGGHPALLAPGGAGAGRQRALNEWPGIHRPFARFGKHVQRRTGGLGHGAVVGLGQLQDIRHAGLAAQKAFNKVVQRAQAFGVVQRDRLPRLSASIGWRPFRRRQAAAARAATGPRA
jgi:hypothetical protein